VLALIAGTGDLPAALVVRLETPPIICALSGFEPDLDVQIPFRIEHLGSFLNVINDCGVTEVCMVGAIQRPTIDPTEIDAATLPLVPRIQAAIAAGDDGALREVISIFEDFGFAIKAAHVIAPDLLPTKGFLTHAKPNDRHWLDATVGEATVAQMGKSDIGQACIVRLGAVVLREDADGTDAMVGRIETRVTQNDGILFKAPKPNQDRRADLPVIGLQTAILAAKAGLDGIVIEAGGVMVLDLAAVIETLNAHGMFIWVRPRGAA
jgi:DUF1009 family protein